MTQEPTYEELMELYEEVKTVAKTLGCPENILQETKPAPLYKSTIVMMTIIRDLQNQIEKECETLCKQN